MPNQCFINVLTAEVLGAAIRKNEKIQGIKILNPELNILQYADDTEIFASTDESINEIFSIIDRYEKGTSAKINVEKTEGLWLDLEKRTEEIK